MTETAEPRNPAQDTVAMTAATMGHDIVAMILNELRTIPGAWSAQSESYQQQSIERFKEKTTETIRKALAFMLTSDFAAVPVKLEDLRRGKFINLRLTAATNAMYRHALYDAPQGANLLLLIADSDKWLTRMDEIKARGDQLDLFNPDADYDPARDQPGYRRDQDPLVPGKSWDELKRSLGHRDAAPPSEPPPTEGAAAPTKSEDPPPGPSLTPEQEREAALRELQADLAAIGVAVSLGLLQSQDEANILAAALWLKWYTSEGIGTPFLAKPAWMPEPPNDPTKGETK